MEPIKKDPSPESDNHLLLKITLILAVITIPLNNKINSWALLIFVTTAFFTGIFTGGLKKLLTNRYWIIPVLFFFWQAATWFWDTTGGFSIKDIEGYGIFLCLPVILTILPRLSAREVIMTCGAFIASIIIVCLICLVKSFFEYRQTGDTRVFFYHYLGYQMGLNAIYLSNYSIACITWVLYYQFLYTGKK